MWFCVSLRVEIICVEILFFSAEREYNLCRNNVCTGAIDGPDYKAWVKRKRLKWRHVLDDLSDDHVL